MYHLETTYSIQIWREMSIWFENTFVVVHAYRLKNSLLGQIWRERSILGRKHKALLVQNTQFFVSLRHCTVHQNLTWNVDLVRNRLKNSLLGQIWRERSILGRKHKALLVQNTQFFVSLRHCTVHQNLTWNVDLVRKHIFGRASL